jgi:endonuclease YncB( thermonuclease family)
MLAIGVVFAAATAWAAQRTHQPDAAPRGATDFPCHVASITDGDTFRYTETDATGRQIRVRVSGIDARERDGSCAPGHPCATASAEAATAALTRLISGQALSCRPTGDTYGRVAAFCRRSDGADVSCEMMASGTAARWDRYWGGHRCP